MNFNKLAAALKPSNGTEIAAAIVATPAYLAHKAVQASGGYEAAQRGFDKAVSAGKALMTKTPTETAQAD